MLLTGRTTDVVHNLIKDQIQKGDVMVDATMGNGHDTAYLADLVGSEGLVYSFDIQAEALDATKVLLESRQLSHQVNLYHRSHIHIKDIVEGPIKGAVFNLGYLPKGDKSVVTQGTETVEAIEQCLDKLVKTGFVVITCYYGHPGGEDEKQTVTKYLCQLDDKKYTTVKVDFINRYHNPPIIFMVEKR